MALPATRLDAVLPLRVLDGQAKLLTTKFILESLNPAGNTNIIKVFLWFVGKFNFSKPVGYPWNTVSPKLTAQVVICNAAGVITHRLLPASFNSGHAYHAPIEPDGTIVPMVLESPLLNPAIAVPANSSLGVEVFRANDLTAIDVHVGLEWYT